MLVIRFLRTGKKNQPFFRIVVTDKRKPPKAGRVVEFLGFINPLTKKRNLKKERIQYWLSKGAKPSATVHNLLISEKIIEGQRIAVHKLKPKTSQEKKPETEPAQAPGEPQKAAVEPIKKEKVSLPSEKIPVPEEVKGAAKKEQTATTPTQPSSENKPKKEVKVSKT